MSRNGKSFWLADRKLGFEEKEQNRMQGSNELPILKPEHTAC